MVSANAGDRRAAANARAERALKHYLRYKSCMQSRRNVTQIQLKTKKHDCPICGAPDIEWYMRGDYLADDILAWARHVPGIGRGVELFDIHPDTEEKEVPF